MEASRRLPRHLRDALGADAGNELVTILDEIRADNAAFKRDLDVRFARIDERFDRIDERFHKVDERFDKVDARFDRVDARLDRADDRFTALVVRISEVKSDLMKWSFIFWCGAVFAVATLAGVLRQ